MKTYELTNEQRRYFGLNLVADTWDKQQLNSVLSVYFDGDKIVKILNYHLGYFEYDTDIRTKERKTIVPKTSRGKEQLLSVSRILKLKGSGIQFSGSFQGGGIHVYDNRRNVFFIKGFSEDGEIRSFSDIENWIQRYISKLPSNYFYWLEQEIAKKRSNIKAREGDIIAYKISNNEYGFARILIDVFEERMKVNSIKPELDWFFPRSFIIMPYAFVSKTLNIEIDILIKSKTLQAICIFDIEVYRGQMPIVGYKPLSEEEKSIQIPDRSETFITVPLTKSEIEALLAK
jgi:hypothetical protein